MGINSVDGGDCTRTHPELLRFGVAVRRAREDRALTQDDVAERAQVPRQTLSLIERGLVNSRLLTQAKIAEGIGVPLHELIRSAAAR